MVDIVGRIVQRAQLSRWLAAAGNGQPVVVVLDGPPGVGKSTLVNWFVAEATAVGATTRTLVVPEQGDIADDLRQAMTETDERMRRGVPQLLIVDDAHWLDDAGQHVVEHLAFRLGTAAVTGQPARVCLLLVARDEASSRLLTRLVDEPITRRMTLGALDDREARELARQITPGITDRRTIARLAELSGGNPLTLTALVDSIAVGEVLPPPSSTTGTIPVEVAWRARLSTLSPAALRVAVVIALAEHNAPAELDDSADQVAALDELESIGAIRRHCDGVAFTHPLLRTTALDLAAPELIVEVAGTLLDQLDRSGESAAGTLVRLSAAARRTADDHHRELVRLAYDEAVRHGSWSAAGDLAEQLVVTAVDLPDRAHWMHRLGTARFNELDRDEATERLIEAADLYETCADSAAPDARARYRNDRAECLLLALRTDFTRSGQRRRTDLDARVAALVVDESLAAHWRARAAAILAEAAYSSADGASRQRLVDTAHELAQGIDEPLTEFLVHLAAGLNRLALLDLDEASGSFTRAHRAATQQSDAWWISGGLSRRALASYMSGDPMAVIGDTTVAAESAASTSNWAEHGLAMAVRSVAATRLGRFADADNDTESTILSARRADAGDPLLASLQTSLWRRAVRGDEPGVATLVEIGRQHQMYIPFAELTAHALLHGVDAALDEARPRWTLPRSGLSFRNVGFHLAQLEAA
ncbi:MAG TPA: ATP-binding protein, partial [Ilumatobacteraceae bacterium]